MVESSEKNVEELANSFQRQLEFDDSNNDVMKIEITGLDILRQEGVPIELEDITLSDDDSSLDESYANDSLELARMSEGRMFRRVSIDSFANDSVEIARNKSKKRTDEMNKTIELPLKLAGAQLDAKNYAPAAPPVQNLAEMKPVNFSNSAA